MKSVIKNALIDALATTLYIIVVASFMFYLQGNVKDSEIGVFAPIGALLLFVFSAALAGMLVVGRPILWYLDGKKKEAISLLVYTLGILFVMIIIVFLLIMFYF